MKRRPKDDGLEHPRSENELAALVRRTAENNMKLRVVGAKHSPPEAIFPEPDPPCGIVKVKLDHYAGWHVRDAARRIVVAEAGIHLGADPSDRLAPVGESLLSQLWDKHRWTLADLGGIAHQTVSGFTATASAGGSIKHSFEDCIYGFRVIDSSGCVTEYTRDHPHFGAMVPNMGLLGVVSAVLFECVEAFDIVGSESCTSFDRCQVDVLGRDPSGGRPSLETFLTETDYARLEWWPQPGVERIVVWQAKHVPHDPGRRRRPYLRFGHHAVWAQIAICLFYTVLVNAGNSHQLHIKLPQVYRAIRGASNVFVAWAIAGVASFLIFVLRIGSRHFVKNVPRWFPKCLGWFVHVDDHTRGRRRGEPQWFTDDSWHGLPMDTVVIDELVPVQFTEIFVPLRHATELVRTMEAHFKHLPNDPESVYERTGLFTFELYAAKRSWSWLSPAFSNGADEWVDGAFRFNAYWLTTDGKPPAKGPVGGVWKVVRESGIPFRLHWGKLQPGVDPPVDPTWVEMLRARYDHWQRFLDLRSERDPGNMFLTPYWCDRLGLPRQEGETCTAARHLAASGPVRSQ